MIFSPAIFRFLVVAEDHEALTSIRPRVVLVCIPAVLLSAEFFVDLFKSIIGHYYYDFVFGSVSRIIVLSDLGNSDFNLLVRAAMTFADRRAPYSISVAIAIVFRTSCFAPTALGVKGQLVVSFDNL